MSVIPIFRTIPLDPEALDCASRGYETARGDLGLRDHIDPLTQVLAQKIIEVVQSGERNPEKIASRAIDALGAALI
jgi:hypothetical protein